MGWALVAGKNLVPSPAAGMTAFLTLNGMRCLSLLVLSCKRFYHPRHAYCRGPCTISTKSARLLTGGKSAKMPTYEYACKECGEHLEVVQSFKDDPLTECPACAGPLRKVFGNIGIAFKGSGFYRTDSRESTKSSSNGSTSSSSGSDGSSSKDKSSSSEKSSGSSDKSSDSASSKASATAAAS